MKYRFLTGLGKLFDLLHSLHYKNGMSIEELAELLGRGEFSIGVRMAKLGLDPPKQS